MITLIPLAGASARFRLHGFAQIKALLPMPDGNTMLAHVIMSNEPETLITVAMREDQKAISSAMMHFPVRRGFEWKAVWLDVRPDGPLMSILCAAKWLRNKEELVVNYCDCFLPDGIGAFVGHMRDKSDMDGVNAGIVAFKNANPRFSHFQVKQGEETLDLCDGGIAWFRHAHEFAKVARRFPLSDSVGLPAVVHAYKSWTAYTGSRYIDLGTPQEYLQFMSEGARG